jgi:hypothetical protein
VSQNKKETGSQLSFYKVAEGDSRDIGFSLRGYEFRWINPRKQERALDRPWRTLEKKDLPPTVLEELAQKRPGLFGPDGMVRRDEMVLGWCSKEAYDIQKKDLAERNRDELMKLQASREEGPIKTKSNFEDFDGFENFKK